MASIRKRGNSYLLVVSMGYDQYGKRRNQQQKTVHPPEGLTPKQTEKWLNEQAVLFEIACKGKPQDAAKDMTFAEYTEIWLRDIAPNKLARSTVIREKKDIERFLPYLGQYKLTDDDYLFRRKQEKLPMCPSTFTFQFKRILKKHGLPEDLNVHSLRHTNASLLIANGTDVTTVAGLLGHSQPSTTLDIYSHAFDKNKRAASISLQDNLEI